MCIYIHIHIFQKERLKTKETNKTNKSKKKQNILYGQLQPTKTLHTLSRPPPPYPNPPPATKTPKHPPAPPRNATIKSTRQHPRNQSGPVTHPHTPSEGTNRSPPSPTPSPKHANPRAPRTWPPIPINRRLGQSRTKGESAHDTEGVAPLKGHPQPLMKEGRAADIPGPGRQTPPEIIKEQGGVATVRAQGLDSHREEIVRGEKGGVLD